MATCKKSNLLHKRKRNFDVVCEEQPKRQSSPDQDEHLPSTTQSQQIRQWRTKDFFGDQPASKSKVNLDPSPDFLLPWLRALACYKSDLTLHMVKIFWNCFPRRDTEKTIVSIVFCGPNSQDHATESYSFQKLPPEINVLVPIPAPDAPFEWSKLNPLNPKIDRRRHEDICKLVLDQEHFERVVAWMEQTPGVTGSNKLEEVELVTCSEFLSTGSDILDDETVSAERKLEALKCLFRGGEAAYRTRVAMNVQLAFVEDMNAAAGKKGLETLLEHICGIVNGDRFLVKSHSSNDDYGMRMSFQPFRDFEEPVGSGDVSTDDDIDISVDNESGSFKSHSRASAANVSKVHPDLTVFLRTWCQVVPLLMVDINSHVTDELFHMQKLLLGGLQFQPEIFGLSINPLTATIYRMKKDYSSRKIFYAFQTYDFEAVDVKAHQIVFESDAFRNMCEDLLKVLKYGLEECQFQCVQSIVSLDNHRHSPGVHQDCN